MYGYSSPYFVRIYRRMPNKDSQPQAGLDCIVAYRAIVTGWCLFVELHGYTLQSQSIITRVGRAAVIPSCNGPHYICRSRTLASSDRFSGSHLPETGGLQVWSKIAYYWHLGTCPPPVVQTLSEIDELVTAFQSAERVGEALQA